jgi:cell division protease FtsH
MFSEATKIAPCLIFIDEIDAVGRQRAAGGSFGGVSDERDQTLNALLVEMDGFTENTNIIIIAATNRPEVLDAALMRAGRFDRQVVLDLPDIAGREAILRVHAAKVKTDAAIDLSAIARACAGMSGADLANLLNESALLAARRDLAAVTQGVLFEARDKVLYGTERRRVMDQEDKRVVAYHEAGHALTHELIGDPSVELHKVSIIPRGRSLGSTLFTLRKDMNNYTETQLLNHIAVAVGGRVSENLVLNERTNGAKGDIIAATQVARAMVLEYGMSPLGMINLAPATNAFGAAANPLLKPSEATLYEADQAVRNIIDNAHRRVTELLRGHLPELHRIAAALMDRESIDSSEVKELIAGPSEGAGLPEEDVVFETLEKQGKPDGTSDVRS